MNEGGSGENERERERAKRINSFATPSLSLPFYKGGEKGGFHYPPMKGPCLVW